MTEQINWLCIIRLIGPSTGYVSSSKLFVMRIQITQKLQTGSELSKRDHFFVAHMKWHQWLCSRATPQLPLCSHHSCIPSFGGHQTGSNRRNSICPDREGQITGVRLIHVPSGERNPCRSTVYPEIFSVSWAPGAPLLLLYSSTPVASNGRKKREGSDLLIRLILACSC